MILTYLAGTCFTSLGLDFKFGEHKLETHGSHALDCNIQGIRAATIPKT